MKTFLHKKIGQIKLINRSNSNRKPLSNEKKYINFFILFHHLKDLSKYKICYMSKIEGGRRKGVNDKLGLRGEMKNGIHTYLVDLK